MAPPGVRGDRDDGDGQRVVEHHGAGVLQSLVGEQTHNYSKRQFAELLARELSFAVLYLFAEFRFFHIS